MLRLRPPPPRVSTTGDHSVSTKQQRQTSSNLQLKSPPRRDSGQQRVDEHRNVVAKNNSHGRKSSIHRSKSKRHDNNDDELTQQHYRHHQRRTRGSIPSSNRTLAQDVNTSEFSHHHKRKRKKGSAYNNNVNTTQTLFIALIRLVIVSTLAYFILIHALSIIYNIFTFIFGLFHYSKTETSSTAHSQLDSSFVQNVEEIRQVLELAKTEFDMLQQQQQSTNGQSSQLLHSVRGEEKIGYFEQIVHPGDKSMKLSVPKFYASVSIGENGRVNIGGERMFRQLTLGKLLTPELAGMIGGTVEEDSKIIGPSEDTRTIFVSIISKSDPRCSTTVTNLLRSAAHPERIRVAVVDRTNSRSSRYVACDAPLIPCSSDPDQILCVYNANVDVYELKDELDAGVMFARHIGQRMYRGEYYALQIGVDAGIAFSEGWDEELIHQLEATDNEMAVISTYLSDANVRDNGPIAVTPERYTICHATYRGDGRERRLEHIRSEQVDQTAPPDRAETPMLQPFWSSDFSFSRGHFVLQVPYDPKICGLDEQDEEISMALRAFSSGYDFYTPTQSFIFRTKEVSSNRVSGVGSCKGNTKNKSRKRLYSLIGLNDNDEEATPYEYGLGAVRDISKFFTLYGIHASERVTEHRLCEFVITGNMHDEFIPHMRRDGMGIDYNSVSFRFHELISIHKDSHQ